MRLLLTLMATALLAVSLGCDNKADTPAAKPATTETGGGAAKTEAPSDGASATSKTEGTQTVSLKLPGMT